MKTFLEAFKSFILTVITVCIVLISFFVTAIITLNKFGETNRSNYIISRLTNSAENAEETTDTESTSLFDGPSYTV